MKQMIKEFSKSLTLEENHDLINFIKNFKSDGNNVRLDVENYLRTTNKDVDVVKKIIQWNPTDVLMALYIGFFPYTNSLGKWMDSDKPLDFVLPSVVSDKMQSLEMVSTFKDDIYKCLNTNSKFSNQYDDYSYSYSPLRTGDKSLCFVNTSEWRNSYILPWDASNYREYDVQDEIGSSFIAYSKVFTTSFELNSDSVIPQWKQTEELSRLTKIWNAKLDSLPVDKKYSTQFLKESIAKLTEEIAPFFNSSTILCSFPEDCLDRYTTSPSFSQVVHLFPNIHTKEKIKNI